MPLKLWRSKRAADPVKQASQQLEKNPRDVLALINRVEAYFAQRDATSALRDVERSLQIALLEPQLQGEARSTLLAKLYAMQSRAYLGLGDRAKALTAAERALNERPDDVDAVVQRGRVHRESYDLDKALQDFGRALELDNSSAPAYVARGMTRHETGDYKGALADFDRAIQLDETLGVAWSSRGRVNLELGNLHEAERDCRTAIRLDPKLNGAYANLAFIARQQGRLGEAVCVLTDGLDQHPDEPGLLVELARAYIDQDRLSEALRALDTALRRAPQYAEALALRGQIHGRSGNLDKSLADLGRAVELNPSDPEAHFNHALAHWHAGNPPEALAAVSRVLQLTPNDHEARAWREKLALLLGLEALDQIAGVLERFAYAHCGPGRRWKVELREMYQFRPGQAPEAFNAAVLDLCQTPQALLIVTPASGEYTVKIMAERTLPGMPRTGFSDALEKTIPAQPDLLVQLLDNFVTTRVLVKSGDQLRYQSETE